MLQIVYRNSRKGVAPSTRRSNPRFRIISNAVVDVDLVDTAALTIEVVNAYDERLVSASPSSRAPLIIIISGLFAPNWFPLKK
jgi:hypothetical protein